MKLYLIEQTEIRGYDTYNSAVVAAKTEEEARAMHPRGDIYGSYSPNGVSSWTSFSRTWARTPEKVTATLIGTAVKGTQKGVIVASFNAG